MNYVQAIVILIGWLDKASEWLSKKHNIQQVDNAIKAVDTDNDVELARMLHDIADKVAQRKKLS